MAKLNLRPHHRIVFRVDDADNFHFLRNVDAVFLRRVDDRNGLRIPVGNNQIMFVIRR